MSDSVCDPMDCSPPGSSVHGILQARILKWVAINKCLVLEKLGNIDLKKREGNLYDVITQRLP